MSGCGESNLMGNPYFTSTDPTLQTKLNQWCENSVVVGGTLDSQKMVDAINTPELVTYFCKSTQPCKKRIVERGFIQNATQNSFVKQGSHTVQAGLPVLIEHLRIHTTVSRYDSSTNTVYVNPAFTGVSLSQLDGQMYLIGSANPTPVSTTCSIKSYLEPSDQKAFECKCNPTSGCPQSTVVASTAESSPFNLIFFIISVVLAVGIVAMIIYALKKI